jgi:threonine dehydrogenase-like Zn-dependent dehydrogenase
VQSRVSHGQRDHAILLLLARLGLRAGDIVQRRLRDNDWKGAWIHVLGKGRRRVALSVVARPSLGSARCSAKKPTKSVHSQCRGPLGGWRFGNTMNGAWAEYLLVPDARANLAPIPDGLSDEEVLLVPDIFSTGLAGAENGGIRVGDTVAVFAQGPIGLCATLGAKLLGASLVIGVDGVPERLEMARRFGANMTIDYRDMDPVAAIKRATEGRGADVAIEALGQRATFENALRAIRPGGTLSSLGVYGGKLVAPYEAFYAGLGDQKIVTSLCPGGKERMRRLMAMIVNRRVDLTPLVTHRFELGDIEAALDLFSHQREGVMKVALEPAPSTYAERAAVTDAAGVRA